MSASGSSQSCTPARSWWSSLSWRQGRPPTPVPPLRLEVDNWTLHCWEVLAMPGISREDVKAYHTLPPVTCPQLTPLFPEKQVYKGQLNGEDAAVKVWALEHGMGDQSAVGADTCNRSRSS